MIYETGSTVYNFMAAAVTHMYPARPGIIVMVAILSMALLAIGVA